MEILEKKKLQAEKQKERQKKYRDKLKENKTEEEYKKENKEKMAAYREKKKEENEEEYKKKHNDRQKKYREKKKDENEEEYNEKARKYMKDYNDKAKEKYLEAIKVVVKEEEVVIKKEVLKVDVMKDVKPLYKKEGMKKLSENTLKNYMGKLRSIHAKITKTNLSKEENEEIEKVLREEKYKKAGELRYYKEDIKKVIKEVRELYTNDNTFKTALIVIASYLSKLGEEYEEEYKEVSNIAILYNKEYEEEKEKQKITKKEEEKMSKISYEEKEIKENLNKLKSKKEKALYVLLMIYHGRLEIFKLKKNEKELSEGNTLIIKNGKIEKIIMKDYKTAKTHKALEIELPDYAKETIEEYINEENLKENDYIFGKDSNKKEEIKQPNQTAMIKSIMLKVYNEEITNTFLRITNATKKTDLPYNERKEEAKKMGHNMGTHERYVHKY